MVIKRILALVVLMAAAAPAALAGGGARKDSGVEQALMQMEQQWLDAYVKKDTAALERIEADDIIMIDPTGKVGTKAQDISDVKAGKLAFESGAFDDMKVRVYGDTAVVTARLTVKGTYGGQDISGAYRGSDVFVKRNGRWQAVLSQVTREMPSM